MHLCRVIFLKMLPHSASCCCWCHIATHPSHRRTSEPSPAAQTPGKAPSWFHFSGQTWKDISEFDAWLTDFPTNQLNYLFAAGNKRAVLAKSDSFFSTLHIQQLRWCLSPWTAVKTDSSIINCRPSDSWRAQTQQHALKGRVKKLGYLQIEIKNRSPGALPALQLSLKLDSIHLFSGLNLKCTR